MAELGNELGSAAKDFKAASDRLAKKMMTYNLALTDLSTGFDEFSRTKDKVVDLIMVACDAIAKRK